MKILFFPNGTTSVHKATDDAHIQLINNKGWMQLYFEFLESKGIDPTKVHFEAVLNKGEWRRILPFKTNTGEWNYIIHNEIE